MSKNVEHVDPDDLDPAFELETADYDGYLGDRDPDEEDDDGYGFGDPSEDDALLALEDDDFD